MLPHKDSNPVLRETEYCMWIYTKIDKNIARTKNDNE